MSSKSPFVYVEDIDLYVEDIESQARSENLVAIVPAGIRSVDTLFSILSNALNFPSYFGRNWNALYDLLRDFWWTDIFQITVIHRDIPALSAAATRGYLDILADCVEDWKPGEDHQLSVVFPVSQKAAIFEAALEYQILDLPSFYRQNEMREIVYEEKTTKEIIDAVAGDEVMVQKCLNRLLDTGEIIESYPGVYRRSPQSPSPQWPTIWDRLIDVPEALQILISALSDTDSTVRGHASDALADMNSPPKDAAPVLITVLNDTDPWVRRQAARALGKIGDPAAVPMLIENLTHRYPQVREAAIDALNKIATPEALKAVKEFNSK